MMPNNVPKVSITNHNKYNTIIQGPTNPRYKTTPCKHFNTPQGCSYGDKCQFAHGSQELRQNNAQGMPLQPGVFPNKIQNSLLNYKIVKCKNWEKDGTCKYGMHCTFAHGDKDLRNKGDNLYSMNNQIMMMPMIYDMNGMPPIMPAGMDLNQMQQLMAAGNMNPNNLMMMNMIPPQQGMMNPPEGNVPEQKNGN